MSLVCRSCGVGLGVCQIRLTTVSLTWRCVGIGVCQRSLTSLSLTWHRVGMSVCQRRLTTLSLTWLCVGLGVCQDRLVTECTCGDGDAVDAAIADGASVNDVGSRRLGDSVTPLVAAIGNRNGPVVAVLLAHGADPNGDNVMFTAVTAGTVDILRQVGADRVAPSTYTHRRTHTNTRTHTYTHKHTYTYTCTHTYSHTYAHTYTHIYAHTQAQT